MVALQCSLWSASTASLPSYQPRLPLQQCQKLSRRDVLSFSHNRKDSLLLPQWYRCRGSRFPLEGAGRRNSSSRMSSAAADPPSSPDSSTPAADITSDSGAEEETPKSFWKNWRTNATELRAKVSKWGLAAVLAYGLFDGITYTTFFILAFLSYEKSTGQNPATNLKALLGVVVLMWGGNNVTRPFRVAGAAALAPFIDKQLKKMQEILKLPNQLFAFMICVAFFACACFSVVAVLVLSRLGK